MRSIGVVRAKRQELRILDGCRWTAARPKNRSSPVVTVSSSSGAGVSEPRNTRQSRNCISAPRTMAENVSAHTYLLVS